MLAAKLSLVISVLPVLLLALLSSTLPSFPLVLAAVTPQTRTLEHQYSDQLQRPPVSGTQETMTSSVESMSKDTGHNSVTSHKQNRDDSKNSVNSERGNLGAKIGLVNSERGYADNVKNNDMAKEGAERLKSVMDKIGNDRIQHKNSIVNVQTDPDRSHSQKLNTDQSDRNKSFNSSSSHALRAASMTANKSSSPEVNGLLKNQNVADSEVVSFHQTLSERTYSNSSSDIVGSSSSNSKINVNSNNNSSDTYSVGREKRSVRNREGSRASGKRSNTKNSKDIKDASSRGYNNERKSSKTEKQSELPRDGTQLTGYWEKRNREYANRTGRGSKQRTNFWSEDIQVGCHELRARRYITDGFCTSENAIREVVCAGHCLPIKDMPWYAEFVKTISRRKLRDWQCVEDLVRRKRVKLLCQNQKYRYYRIKVVKSCKCKKMTRHHNRTRLKNGKRRKKGKGKKNRQAKTS